ncbi:MAG: NADH-quinone oxidoreductase subunit H [Acetobacteraceae bacterium]|nr:NADH-quinone oxidoreductase subunit H [Acetobacteraceae bacterium]
MNALMQAVWVLVFPGFLFLFVYALFCEWLDRKLYARLQNRVGPPWFQPFADFVKLLAKEDVVPKGASRGFFLALPPLAVAAVASAFLYVPVYAERAPYWFQGDIIVVAYLLSLPTLIFFLAGWYSNNPFSSIGATRAVTQLLAYEVPLLLVILGPALISGEWSVSGASAYMRSHPALIPVQLLGLAVAVVALQGKLERVPFDIPEAETEIVAGTFTEFGGRRLALFRLATDMEMVVGAALLGSLFLGGYGPVGPVPGFVFFLLKTLFIVFLLCCLRAVSARIRIDQMVGFCFRWLIPAAVAQVLILVALKGWWLP